MAYMRKVKGCVVVGVGVGRLGLLGPQVPARVPDPSTELQQGEQHHEDCLTCSILVKCAGKSFQ